MVTVHSGPLDLGHDLVGEGLALARNRWAKWSVPSEHVAEHGCSRPIEVLGGRHKVHFAGPCEILESHEGFPRWAA